LEPQAKGLYLYHHPTFYQEVRDFKTLHRRHHLKMAVRTGVEEGDGEEEEAEDGSVAFAKTFLPKKAR
jgi:hypothetical protein